ncbi:MAG: hypothetical protein M1486_00420 [Gammaproteobacteria bacterium]|nr:hypothetical protein [Gammaproteobacteria bacterium]
MDALYAATQEAAYIQVPNRGRKKGSSSKKNEKVTMWGEDFDTAIEYLLHDVSCEIMDVNFTDPKKRDKDWNGLTASVKKEIIDARSTKPVLTKEELLEKILLACKKNIKNSEDPDEIIARIKNRLSYTLSASPNKETNVAIIREGIKDIVARELLNASSNPGEGQAPFYEQVNALITPKLLTVRFDLSPVLTNFNTHPVPKDEIRKAIIDAFAAQNLKTTEAEIEIQVNDLAERLSGQKALVELLDNQYRPVESDKRELTFSPLDGQKRLMFITTHEILQKMDADVLKLEQRISDIQAERKAAISALDKEIANVRSKLDGGPKDMGSDKNVAVLNSEWNAIRRMIDGIKKFFNSFTTDHYVKVNQDAIEFFDEQFELPKIIGDEVSATVDLEFTPPEYFDLNSDLLAQRQQLNGIAQFTIENIAEQAINGVNKTVAEEAGNVEARIAVVKINGMVVEDDSSVEQQAEVEVTKDLLQVVTRDKTGVDPSSSIARSKSIEDAYKYKKLIREENGRADLDNSSTEDLDRAIESNSEDFEIKAIFVAYS